MLSKLFFFSRIRIIFPLFRAAITFCSKARSLFLIPVAYQLPIVAADTTFMSTLKRVFRGSEADHNKGSLEGLLILCFASDGDYLVILMEINGLDRVAGTELRF